jgi:NCAIR mutase (PurE)-related protein
MGDPYGCNCDIEFRKLERKHEEDLKAARAEGFEQGVREMTAVMGSDQTDVVKAARKVYERDLDAMKKVLEKEAEVKVSKARAEVKWAESRLHAAREEGYAAAVADVVAWLRASPGLDQSLNAATFIGQGISIGAHIGAAKKK